MTGTYVIKGTGDVTLQQRDFLAKGGEKTIYVKRKTAFAIYHDPKRMIPVGKIQELSVLNDSRICGPKTVLLDHKGVPVGYTMSFLKGYHSLCELITKTFQQNNNVTPAIVLRLVQELQKLVIYVHAHTILIVDLNELNFLTDPKFKSVCAIDVNSWQTPSFPADAILTSVRDQHAKGWDVGTDWFSWAIVTFQLQVGAHPYKGGHPDYTSIPKKDGKRMIARMEHNISAFHANATLPGCCSPLDIIPKGLRRWYEAVFEKGERSAPPIDYDTAVVIAVPVVKRVAGSNLFDIAEVGGFVDSIIKVYYSFGTRVVCTQNSIVVGERSYTYGNAAQMSIGFTQKMNKPFGLIIGDSNKVSLIEIETGTVHDLGLAADDAMAYDGRLYARTGTNVLEIIFTEVGPQTIISTKSVGQVLDMPQATKVYDGVIVQNLLGRYFISVFPQSGRCHQVGIPELDGYRVLDARYENHVFMALAEKSGKYDRLVVRLSDDFQTHDVRIVEDVDYTGLNFAVTDAGICVCLNEEEKVEVFSRKSSRPAVKVMEDPAIKADMRLFHDGAQILVARGNELYGMTMKK